MAIDKVTSAAIADGAVSADTLTSTAITGQTAETTIASDDLILLSDTSASGALKKMTRSNFVSGIGGTNTPVFGAYKAGDQGSIAANVWTKVTGFAEEFDPQSTWDNSNGKFTPAVSGKYFIYATVYLSANDGSFSKIAIGKNGSRIIETVCNAGRTEATPFQVSCIAESDADDYFEIYVRQPTSSGTAYSNGVQVKFGAFKLLE